MKTPKTNFFLLVLALLCFLPCHAGTAKKVLVYMFDGIRADVLEAVNAPVWQALKEGSWAEGYHSAWSVDAVNEPFLQTISAPNHTAIATGHLFADHHVGANNTFNNYLVSSFIS